MTTDAWRHYDEGEDSWLIRRTEKPGARPLVVVVRALDIFNSVQSDRAEAALSPVQFAFTDILCLLWRRVVDVVKVGLIG